MGGNGSRVNEQRTVHAVKIPVSTAVKVGKSICKIFVKKSNNEITGTGFFMIINENNCNKKFLLTNYHIISEELIDENIKVKLHNDTQSRIKLNKRNIKFFDDLDITMIELKNSDDIINTIEFLYYDLNYLQGYDQYKDIDIFTIQYPRDEQEVASGKIIEILDNFEFKHTIDTEAGSSGSPIMLPTTLKVIDIHKQGDSFDKINYGTFIGEIFKYNKKNKQILSEI